MVFKMSKRAEDCELETLNLEDVVKKYAVSFLDPDDKKRADLEHAVINWDFMHISHGETRYTKTTDYAKPTAHVLFTANFVNDTLHTQTHALHTERRTKSTCSLTFKRVYTFGASLKLSLSPPTSVIGASVGFKRDVSREQGVTETSEHDLSWSVDNQIQVPSGFKTKAELVIKEDNYSGDFTIPSTFEGKVVVLFRDKITNDHLETVSASVKRIFENSKEFSKDNQGRPVFVVKGVCKCKYGIEQNVYLKESKIDPDVDHANATATANGTDEDR